MNNIKVSNSSVSFGGLIVKGTVSPQNVKKLGDFASKIENTSFISYLEKDFGVDVILNNEITQMSFAHKTYGSLSEKFGCKSYPLENVFRNVTEVIKDIKAATTKAAKDWEKVMAEKDTARRGC